ncbi:MAG: hypothetical protein KJP21_09240 [Bacteroidia bacterium]|nr:hypothetical protein [Bacteroidia bacterium]NNJ56809.1 hypothetical protein [Bacteroidia bacterium]
MSLLNWLKNKNTSEKNDQLIADAGLCPNCWGQQSYDGKFVRAVKDKQIDINNHDSTATRAFIQDFVKTHLEPITLQNNDVFDQCPTCKVKYASSKKI